MSLRQAFGPVMTRPAAVEVMRNGVGAGIGLLASAVLLHGLGGWPLLAPLGASSVLVYAAPNSPLAQPWSVVVGNVAATLVGLIVVAALPAGIWVAPLAVTLAIAAMLTLRAMHPPGGALALLVASGGAAGWTATLLPVLTGSVLLVLIALPWSRLTGRTYPFRQPSQPGPHGTRDPVPEQRLGLDPAELATILDDYRQSANLGVSDLARLIGAAEQAAAGHRMDDFACQDIMSRDLVTVLPDAPLSTVATLFRAHGFTALPVVAANGQFEGVIFQIDLIRRAREDAFRMHSGFIAAFVRLIDERRTSAPAASDIMQTTVARAMPLTAVGALLPLLADGGAEAVPVVVGPTIVGIVTRSDLVSALARRLARD